MSTDKSNPYVGPRTFQKEEGHLFFGREREARDLLSLVVSQRLVLFYAQSGAGKSSIINTRLIPNLEERGFEVLPVGRVSGDTAPTGMDSNVYAFNLMRKLVQHEENSAVLAGLQLCEFLENLNSDEQGYFYDPTVSEKKAELPVSWRHVLIIDQFEEIFSTHPEAWDKREDFFRQLATAMQEDPHLWVVLVMREDYIASLDPYAHLLPGGLRARYYMQRLGREAALKAVKNPVQALRPFAPKVAEKLVDDLCSIKVRKPDGSLDSQPGQYVEPVQMQVVCYSLWENLPDEGTNITEENLREVGDVNQSLARYYGGRVKAVAADPKFKVKERAIREWFEKELITAEGVRNIVLQEPGKKSGGLLDDQVIQALQSDLVRAENRSGATWYELTHDRLVEPILTDNKDWFQKNSSLLQQQAKLWNEQGRNESWLLADQALAEVEAWAKDYQDELTDVEQQFLRACQKREEQALAERETQRRELEMANKLAEEQARAAKRARIFTFIFLGLFVVALFATFYVLQLRRDAITLQNAAVLAQEAAETAALDAQSARDEAVESAKEARLGELAGLALSEKDNHFDLALLFGVEGYSRGKTARTEGALLSLLDSHPGLKRFLNGHQDSVNAVAFSSDGQILASASDDSRVILWDMSDPDDPKQLTVLEGDGSAVYSLAFSPAGGLLASGASSGIIFVWDISDPANASQVATLVGYPAYAVAFSSDGQMLASGGDDRTVILWDMSDPANPVQLASRDQHSDSVASIAFSPTGRIMASASYDNTVILWDISDPVNPVQLAVLEGHDDWVNDVEFSPDGKIMASASDDSLVILWNVEDPANPVQLASLEGHNYNAVLSVAFSPDGSTLASGGGDYHVVLWDVSVPSESSELSTMQGHSDYVYGVAFSPDGLTLASGSYDTRIIIWSGVEAEKSSHLATIEGDNSLRSVAFSPGDWILAAGDYDGLVSLWDVHDPANPLRLATLEGHSSRVNAIAFSSDARTLASASDDSTIILWNVTDPANASQLAMLEGHSDWVSSIAFSSDNRILASTSGSQILVWDVSDPANPLELASIEQDSYWINNVAISPDGDILAAGTADGLIILWDIKDPAHPQKLTALVEDEKPIYAIEFSPGGGQLVAGSYRKIVIWDVNDPTRAIPLATLTGHGDSVRSLGFSPDGSRLASGSYRSIILWDVSNAGSPTILATLAGHDGYVYGIDFGPDSNTIATVSFNIILQKVDKEKMIELACNIAGRNFTLLEWIQYFPGEDYHQTCPQWLKGEDYYREFINRELSNAEDSEKVQAALSRVMEEMQNDAAITDPDAEASRLVTEAVDREFYVSVKAEKFQLALDLLEQAQSLELDLPYANMLLSLADAELRAGQLEQALVSFKKLDSVQLDPDDAYLLSDVCWDGSLWGYAQRVLRYCEQAVEMGPENGDFRDSRGLARALTGDFAGAIDDFEYSLQWFTDNGYEKETIQQRELWLEALKAARNPFDSATLEQLKGPNEGDSALNADDPIVAVTSTVSIVDTFEDNSNGWFTGPSDTGTTSIVDGHYVWDVKLRGGSDAWQFLDPSLSIRNFDVKVDAKRVGGTTGDLCYGIIFRANEKNINGIVPERGRKHYEMEVCDHQYYLISYYDGNEWKYWAEWTQHDAIRPGDWNTLEVRASDTQFAFYINSVKVAEFNDASIEIGNVGLSAYSYNGASGQGEIWFDNFSLQEK